MSAQVDVLSGIQWWTHVVVDGVQDGAASELGGTAREVVDVVVLEGDLVVRAGEVQVPVVVSVASGRPLALAIDVAVGDRDTAGGILAQDDVLTGDLVGGDVVDPDQVSAGEGDGITTPDVLGVQLGDADVLNDDVLHAVGHAQTLALDDSGGARAEDGLVRGDLNGAQTGLVVSDRDGGSVGLVVGAPVVLVDGLLASGASSPGSASGLGGGALGSGEVEGLGQDDDASLGVGEVGDTGGMISTIFFEATGATPEHLQLVSRGRRDSSGITTTSDRGSETLRGSGDGRCGGLRQSREASCNKRCGVHLGDSVE